MEKAKKNVRQSPYYPLSIYYGEVNLKGERKKSQFGRDSVIWAAFWIAASCVTSQTTALYSCLVYILTIDSMQLVERTLNAVGTALLVLELPLWDERYCQEWCDISIRVRGELKERWEGKMRRKGGR